MGERERDTAARERADANVALRERRASGLSGCWVPRSARARRRAARGSSGWCGCGPTRPSPTRYRSFGAGPSRAATRSSGAPTSARAAAAAPSDDFPRLSRRDARAGGRDVVLREKQRHHYAASEKKISLFARVRETLSLSLQRTRPSRRDVSAFSLGEAGRARPALSRGPLACETRCDVPAPSTIDARRRLRTPASAACASTTTGPS